MPMNIELERISNGCGASKKKLKKKSNQD